MKLRYFIFIVLLIHIWSCNNSSDVDLSKVQLNYQSYNFYKDFQKIDTLNIKTSLDELQSEYPEFLNFYCDTLMGFGSLPYNDSLAKSINIFLNYKDLKFLADTINTVYPNTKDLDNQIKDLMLHVKYYFPEWPTQKVIYFNGGLKLWSAVSYKDMLCIGLDMYLGDNFPYYASRQIPQYMMPTFNKIQIPVMSGKVIFNDLHYIGYDNADFLKIMIENGKIIYFLTKVLPDIPINEFYEMSEEKYEWMENNEAEIFNFFVQKEMLFTTSWKDIVKYINDGPLSPGMPQGAPAKTGVFIGYKIVKQYMEKSESSLKELIQNEDIDKIYKISSYKPL